VLHGTYLGSHCGSVSDEGGGRGGYESKSRLICKSMEQCHVTMDVELGCVFVKAAVSCALSLGARLLRNSDFLKAWNDARMQSR
jgi:hypothetical protein